MLSVVLRVDEMDETKVDLTVDGLAYLMVVKLDEMVVMLVVVKESWQVEGMVAPRVEKSV